MHGVGRRKLTVYDPLFYPMMPSPGKIFWPASKERLDLSLNIYFQKACKQNRTNEVRSLKCPNFVGNQQVVLKTDRENWPGPSDSTCDIHGG
jgi:hypothetical protein